MICKYCAGDLDMDQWCPVCRIIFIGHLIKEEEEEEEEEDF